MPVHAFLELLGLETYVFPESIAKGASVRSPSEKYTE